MLNILHVIFFTLIFLFSFSKSAYCLDEIYDDFNSINTNYWTFDQRDGSISVSDGILKIGPPVYGLSPIIYSNFDQFLEDNSAIEFKFKLDRLSFHGMGISIGFTGGSDYPYYEFSLWLDNVSPGIKLEYNDYSKEKYSCAPFLVGDDVRDRLVYPISISTDWNTFRITRSNGAFSVYLNNLDTGSSLVSFIGNDCIPKNIFLGNPLNFYGYGWSSFSLDHFVSFYLDKYPVNSNSDKKYIILPGLGASWNLEAMVYDREVDDEDWTMTPFVKSYHGIVDLFESNDLDYDVWNYDWRKPLVEIVGDFEEYISKNTDDNDEIYVVGHSLGGLVARLWQQKNNYDRVGKVISIGSPHLGALRAYEAYNGAKLTDGFGLDSVMWNLYLTLIDKGGLETAENIREMVPILKDLSPVYDFLEKNGRMIPSSETFYNNYFLTDWNNEHQESNNLWLFSGFGVLTGKELRLEERNIFEKILNIWPDGRPISTVYSDGDGTVISQSSAADFGEVEYFGGKHSDLVNVSLPKIAEILGLNNLVTREEENDYEGRLFFIGSPAEMKVSCEGMGEIHDELGFVFVSSDESEGECEVQILGTDSGTYHFVAGNIEENKWFYSENEINNGEIVEFTFDSEINGGESGLNRSFLKQQILRDINILKSRGIKADYKKIIKLLERLQLENLVDEILEIRQRSGEGDLTKRMVENCVRLSPGRHQNSKSAWNKNIKKIIEAYIKIAEKKALIDELKGGDIKRLRAENYLWMRQIMEEINDDNFQNHLRFRVVNRLFTGI